MERWDGAIGYGKIPGFFGEAGDLLNSIEEAKSLNRQRPLLMGFVSIQELLQQLKEHP
jgi:hypothetical protein